MKSKKTSKGTRTLLEEQQRIYKKTAKRIKDIRIERGYSNAEDFAYENDFSRSQYGKYEHELGTDMRLSTIVKITKALNISIQEFFSEGFDS